MSLEIDIKKTWPGFRLDVRFKAEREIVGFLGASGSGKSMTLKCIAGIVRPDEGVIIADGVPLFDSDKKINVPPRRRETGYMFQNAALFPNMTARQNVLCAAKGMPDRSRKLNRVKELFSIMGLDGLQDRYPAELSGGQQQRVALARILMSEPNVLMLDEPFSALDSYLRWQLEQELAVILGEFGGTSLFVSHNRDEVYRLCHRVAVVSRGTLVADGDKWELFNDPRSYDACLLTGCKNISPAGPVSDRTIAAGDWDMTLECGGKPAGDVKYVGIRAHDIVLTDACDLPNCFEFEAVSTLRDTFSYILLIRKAGSNAAKTLRLEMSREKYESLKTLPRYVQLPPEKLLLLDK
ncbi:molybdate transport system ATP-binding protein [Sporobacter termitidis DSM 10068]|uniref:Molybdate transport system ATP-binding protein n=1 Tax=Sporobacter termitidis DSM 10068 TaxID=1123282 RepID=A0A1M5TXB3_9FIRM|nr:ATP-binding cassette domain-containing protein [Sporobacter termitidis]SHH55432.1 molybdate transport system ATP-binding protein [Sporobacter termitidis DSM 10068]